MDTLCFWYSCLLSCLGCFWNAKMNEKIKELVYKAWEQANKETSEDDWYTWVHDEIFQTKLVELVVKECVDIIQLESDNAIRNNTYMGDDVPASVTQLAIKKHFGLTK